MRRGGGGAALRCGEQRGSGRAEDRPQPCMGSEKTPGAGNRGYPAPVRGSGLPQGCWARVLRVSGETWLSTARSCHLPALRRLLEAAVLSQQRPLRHILHFPREPEPRMPIVVKVRRTFCGSGTSQTLRPPSPALFGQGSLLPGGKAKDLRLSVA